MSIPSFYHRWKTLRNARRKGREALFQASHARGMREDVTRPETLRAFSEAEKRARRAMRGKDPGAILAAAGALSESARQLYPPNRVSAWRERLETVVVAGAIAMAVRTYFVQPFKIPTGSMQPTLHGVRVFEQTRRAWYDVPPISFAVWALTGERYKEVRAKAAGVVPHEGRPTEDGTQFIIAGAPHFLPREMNLRVQPGARIHRGDVLASGRIRMGDHIFVNKVRYNFSKPKRGDIFVFDTHKVRHPAVRGNSFYIKRLVGLPGETIRIDPPYLEVNGERVTYPDSFRRLAEDKTYGGYVPAPGGAAGRPPWLGSSEDRKTIGPREYLPFGDNTHSSLDGRHFGPVPKESIVGPAFWVYWPFGDRWGPIRR